MNSLRLGLPLAFTGAIVLGAGACSGPGMTPSGGGVPATRYGAVRGAIGLGPVLSTKLGGTVLGWDMNQNGNDGFLTEAVLREHNVTFGTETFDETAATVTKLVNQKTVPGGNDEPFAEAVMGSDVGFIDVQRTVVHDGIIHRDDGFRLMNPVAGNRVNGTSSPRKSSGLEPNFVTNNQSSPIQAMMAYRILRDFKQGVDLYVYDSAANTWIGPHAFPRQQVFAGYALYAAVDARSGNVFVSYQTGTGNYENLPPRFDVFDGRSGSLLRHFDGLGKGFLNGMAVDSTTGVLCTTTFGDMNVEFYDDSTGKGFVVKIPGQGGPLTQGAAVAADPVNHLFLIAQQNSTVGGSGSAVLVYDEQGDLVESITGFNFLNQFSPIPVHIAVNGTTRIGYVPGPNANKLQSFTY